MDAGVVPIVEQFRVSTNLFAKALDGMDRDALLTRPGGRSNPPLWVAGHLAQWRARIVALVGGTVDVPWEGMFETGSVVGDLTGYPDAETVVAVWNKLSDDLLARLEQLTDEQLAAPPPPRVASPNGTLLGALALLAFHEGYHVGQLGYLRRWIGFTSLLD